jgi:methylated-DNA-[protein]-cysteine S-methyltransferase
MNLVRTIVDSPIGPLTVVADDDAAAVVEIRFPGAASPDVEVLPPDDAHPVLAQAARELGEYFAGERTTFDVALAPRGTPFQRAAWEALRTIPYGETVSYGEQARRLGDVNKSRAVGAANARNPIPIIVPCHRVVGSDGSLTGFGGGLGTKAWLLDHERSVAETDLRLF